jgi:hypothetical protein
MEFLLPLLVSLPPAAFSLIGMALFIGTLIVAIAYMVAYFLQSPQMVALAKEELAALFFTVFILLFWLSFDTTINSIANGMLAASLPGTMGSSIGSCSGDASMTMSHIHLALASLDIMDTKLKNSYIDLYLFEALVGFLSTISFPLGSPMPAVNIISFSLAPFVGLTLLSNAHTVIVEAVGYLITVVWAKEFIVLFARDAIPLFLLPLGLVMRAFPVLRRTGSSIIALSFAAYFIFPFAVLLSNFMIFDIFQPADFAYTPTASSFFDTDRNDSYFEGQIEGARDPESGHAQHLFDQFNSPDVVEEAYDDPLDDCVGNMFTRFFCSVKNIFNTAVSVVGSFFATVWSIWKFMMGMTGDFFFTAFNNPLMPASASAGLYHFLILEISLISPFMILIMFTTVIEIIITITMYRNVSLLIGGEAEIVGLTKIV